MPMIPDRIYRLCEKKLAARYMSVFRATERLKEVQARAYTVPGMRINENGGGGGKGRGDAVAQKALSVAEAEKALENALRWEAVFQRLESVYPKESKEGRIAERLYGWAGAAMRQEAVCRLLRIDRKTCRKYRDTYVINCALLAAAEGLIGWEGENSEH